MAHANFMYYSLSPLPRPQAGIDVAMLKTIPNSISNEQKLAWVFCLPETRAVDKLGFHLSSYNGAETREYIISLQSTDDSGDPDGVVGNATGTFKVQDLAEGTFNWVDLLESTTIDAGKFYAIVLEEEPLIANGGIRVAMFNKDFQRMVNPITLKYDNGLWKSAVSDIDQTYPGAAAIRYTGTSEPFAFGNPISSEPNVTPNFIDTANTGERVAMRFKLPSNLATNFKVAGVRIWASNIVDPQVGEGKIKLGLWKDPNILLQEKEFRPNWTTSDGDWSYWELYFGESSASSSSTSCPFFAATLNYDTVYYVGIEQIPPDPSESDLPGLLQLVTVRRFDSVNYPYHDLDAYPGGREVYAAKYEEEDSVWQWTEVKNARPMIDLILSDTTGT